MAQGKGLGLPASTASRAVSPRVSGVTPSARAARRSGWLGFVDGQPASRMRRHARPASVVALGSVRAGDVSGGLLVTGDWLALRPLCVRIASADAFALRADGLWCLFPRGLGSESTSVK